MKLDMQYKKVATDLKEETKKRVGLNMKQIRKKQGFSVEFMARELKVSYATYYHWEKADNNYLIPIYNLIRVAEVLKVDIKELLKGLV